MQGLQAKTGTVWGKPSPEACWYFKQQGLKIGEGPGPSHLNPLGKEPQILFAETVSPPPPQGSQSHIHSAARPSPREWAFPGF